MSAPALRYDLRREGRTPLVVEVPGGTTQRLRLPDSEAKARLIGAVLTTRCAAGEELELFGEPVRGLRRAERARLHDRIGIVTQAMGLISNLNAWENISLQAAYHGTQPVARIAKTARDALAALGTDPARFLARLPDEMDPFERKLVAFVRLLAKEPALAVIDDLGEGLNREQSARAARFEAEYRARQPEGTLLFVDLAEEGDSMSEEFRPPVRFPHLLAKVNAFLLVAVVLVGSFVAIVAHKQGWFVNQTMIRVITPDALGISKGMPVKLFGYTIGSVKEMQLVNGGVDVQLAIMSEHMPRIPKGSRARFARESGVIGASVIEITPGKPINGELAEGEQIDFDRSRGISEIVEEFRRQAAPAFAELKNALSQVNRSGDDLAKILAAMRAETEQLPATHKAMRRFFQNADQATLQLNTTLQSMQRASESVERATPALAAKLATTLDSIDGAVGQLRQTAAEAQDTLRGVRPMIDRSESTMRDASEVFSAAKRVWPLSDAFKDTPDAMLPIDSFDARGAPGPGRP